MEIINNNLGRVTRGIFFYKRAHVGINRGSKISSRPSFETMSSQMHPQWVFNGFCDISTMPQRQISLQLKESKTNRYIMNLMKILV